MSFTSETPGSLWDMFLRASYCSVVSRENQRMGVPWIRIGRRMPRIPVGRLLLVMLVITLLGGVRNPQAAGSQSGANDLGIRWIEVEAGTFTMGLGDDAKEVTVRRFMISATEVTFDQYDAF